MKTNTYFFIFIHFSLSTVHGPLYTMTVRMRVADADTFLRRPVATEHCNQTKPARLLFSVLWSDLQEIGVNNETHVS